jgi:hypothetical protein
MDDDVRLPAGQGIEVVDLLRRSSAVSDPASMALKPRRPVLLFFVRRGVEQSGSSSGS